MRCFTCRVHWREDDAARAAAEKARAEAEAKRVAAEAARAKAAALARLVAATQVGVPWDRRGNFQKAYAALSDLSDADWAEWRKKMGENGDSKSIKQALDRLGEAAPKTLPPYPVLSTRATRRSWLLSCGLLCLMADGVFPVGSEAIIQAAGEYLPVRLVALPEFADREPEFDDRVPDAYEERAAYFGHGRLEHHVSDPHHHGRFRDEGVGEAPNKSVAGWVDRMFSTRPNRGRYYVVPVGTQMYMVEISGAGRGYNGLFPLPDGRVPSRLAGLPVGPNTTIVVHPAEDFGREATALKNGLNACERILAPFRELAGHDGYAGDACPLPDVVLTTLVSEAISRLDAARAAAAPEADAAPAAE